jgi:CheY-like chemotaxis protein
MAPSRDAVRVLHIDDEDEVLDVTGRLLEAHHDRLSVDPVRATDDALGRLDEADCIVADYVMPGMDGAEFLARVRRERPSLPVVFFTGRDAEELDESVLGADLTAHVRKGVSADQYATLADRVADLAEGTDRGPDTPVGVGERGDR